MRSNLKLVVNNPHNKIEEKHFFEKKIPPMPLVSGILITFFGGLTIYFNDPIFIYVKPTIINIMFALALFFGKYFTNEPILKKIMGKSIPLTDIGWEILNKRWMFFFLRPCDIK